VNIVVLGRMGLIVRLILGLMQGHSLLCGLGLGLLSSVLLSIELLLLSLRELILQLLEVLVHLAH